VFILGAQAANCWHCKQKLLRNLNHINQLFKWKILYEETLNQALKRGSDAPQQECFGS
jgi:hypothetical protein